MTRVRGTITTILLCAFAVLGLLMLVPALILFGLHKESSMLGAVVDASGTVLLAAALMLTLPALAALLLKPRLPTAASAVATMFGLGVFAVTASQATSDGMLLALNLAGLVLLLCSLPLPADQIDGQRGEPGPGR